LKKKKIVLARLEAFLPELKKANETLDASEASIEKEEEEQGPKIEMVSMSVDMFESKR